MCPYPSSESVGHGDYHFCGMVSDSMPCQKVREMFVQYAPLFIMTLSEYVPISFIGKCRAQWLSLLWENNDRWTQDKHLLHVWCNLLFDAFIVMIGHHIVPRLMSNAWYQLMHTCIVLPSHEHHWYGLNVPSHWSQVCYIDSTDHYLPTITFHHLCADLSFNAKVQGLQIQTWLIWSHNYTNPMREKDHTCSCQRFTDIIDSISWYITFKKKSMVIWSGRKW